MYKRKILLGISDTHAAFKFGLINPATELKESDTGKVTYPTLNNRQEYLWETYTWGLKEVQKLAGKDDIHVLHGGDISHGNKHIGEQISTKQADQIKIAYWNFRPVLEIKNVKSLSCAIGTGAHNFGEGTSEELAIQLLQEHFQKKYIDCTYHGLIKYGNFSVDLSHHGSGVGSMPWTKSNSARSYLQATMMGDLDAGETPADLFLRGHVHTFVKTWASITRSGIEYESWLVILPSLCMLGDFGTQITRSLYRISPGMVAFEIIDDRLYKIHPFMKPLDIRTTTQL